MIFRNHSNMLICCSRNISDFINVENSCAALYFLKKTVMHFIFQDSLMNRKFKRTAFLCNRNHLSHSKCLYCVYINSLHDEDIQHTWSPAPDSPTWNTWSKPRQMKLTKTRQERKMKTDSPHNLSVIDELMSCDKTNRKIISSVTV